MKILLANPRGFCAGVNMAIDSLDRAIKLFPPPIYVYHEIVHNKPVVQRFKAQGVRFVESVEGVPNGATLLFSAHGVSPEIREQAKKRNILAIDATCPLVTKVHLEAIRFAKEGYQILLIGHEGHDEVIGTMGEAPHCIHLVESETQVAQLRFPAKTKLAYLTQTTLSVDDANRIIGAIKTRFPEVVGPPREDICYATQNRQEAIHSFSPEADLVLVLGSQNSSNSLRLAEIAKTHDCPAYLIDGVGDLKDEWFIDVNTILVTAGASAPEDVVQNLVTHLKLRFNAELEERVLRTENVHFALPRELRVGLNPAPSAM